MWKITPAELEKMLMNDILSPLNPIVFIWGQPGVGKTQIVQQICQTLQLPLVIIEVSTIHPYALSGIPIPNIRQKRVEMLPLSFISQIEEHKDKKMVLFLDDFGAADPQQQRIALSITTYRQVGDFALPEKCSIVIATNREEDAAYVITPSYAVLNRAKHYRLVPSFDDWIKWMKRNHGDKEPLLSMVIKFLISNPSFFCWTPETAIKKRTVAYPTPRTWTNFIVENYRVLDLSELAKRCAAWVGDECASAFYQFHLIEEEKIQEVIEKPTSIQKYSKIHQILIIERVIQRVKEQSTPQMVSRLQKILENVENDVLSSVLPKLKNGESLEKLCAIFSVKLVKDFKK